MKTTLMACAVCFQEKSIDLMRSSDTCHECSEQWRSCERCIQSTVAKSWRDGACPSCGYKSGCSVAVSQSHSLSPSYQSIGYKSGCSETVKNTEVHQRGSIFDMKNFIITLNILAAILYGLILAEESPGINSTYDVFAWLLPVGIAGINVFYLGAYEAPMRPVEESGGKEKKENIIALWIKVKRKQLEEQL
jgi:hypothetical protein